MGTELQFERPKIPEDYLCNSMNTFNHVELTLRNG
jgi:hypothetical protein